MSVKNFKFVSPGVFINEIDNSFRPRVLEQIGPVVIGRSQQGLAMTPTKVESYRDFVNQFGDTVPGSAESDVYRTGVSRSPMYGTYAAKAHLEANDTPLTYVRLLGQQSINATAGGKAGWQTTTGPAVTGDGGGAYGLFVATSASLEAGLTAPSGGDADHQASNTGSFALGAIFYADSGAVLLSGSTFGQNPGATTAATAQIDFTNAPTATNTITIIATDGTTATFECTAGTTSATQFSRAGVKNGADNLKTAIEASTIAAKVTVSAVSEPTGGTFRITLTQATGGSAGNTAITSNLANVDINDGSSGADGAFTGGLTGPATAFENGLTGAINTFINSQADGTFSIAIDSAKGTVTDGVRTFSRKVLEFNFNDSSNKFIRKQLNTDPTLISANASNYYSTDGTGEETYWLGESYEQFLTDQLTSVSTRLVGIMLPLGSGSATAPTKGPSLKRVASSEACAGWFIAQDVGDAGSFDINSATKLFRLKGRGHGEWLHKNVKVTIERIRQSTSLTDEYGTFSVVLRALNDTDQAPQVVERFDNLNLNPASPNYIGKMIGDRYIEWDEQNRRLREYGDYPNQSKYVYCEVNDSISNPALIPFGFFGPPMYGPDDFGTDNVTTGTDRNIGTTDANVGMIAIGKGTSNYGAPLTHFSGGFQQATRTDSAGPGRVLFTPVYPQIALVSKDTDAGASLRTDTNFGIRTSRAAGSNRPASGLGDVLNMLTADAANTDASTLAQASTALRPYSYIFTLDDIVSGSTDFTYTSGSRAGETSWTAQAGNDYTSLLDLGYDSFTAPFFGGFDGLDITKPDPLANHLIGAGATAQSSYIFHTYRQALETVSDPELLDYDLLAVPGLTNESLTNYMVDICEERRDAFALIDLPNVYTPTHEGYLAKNARANRNVTSTSNALRNRRFDSSYAATFYPWIQTRDANTGQALWAPPSVAMMGVLASSAKQSELWFAPAGFNRGGLSDGAAGIPVLGVSQRLSAKERDTLYDARINPIASFPSTGIVVLGQKTLQERPSALDRINVRRLVIYLKKQISILSTQILFEQNVQATWSRFKGLVEPFLANVKTRYGISDYRLILDETTTTPDLVDQNILYAKIMIKPARAIEFIAIDFVVANTGASFDD